MAQAPTGSTTVEALRERIAGDLILPDTPGYDEARTVFNA